MTLSTLASLFCLGFGGGIVAFGFVCGLVAVPVALFVVATTGVWLVHRKR